MWLKEFEGKKLLSDYGIPVLEGQIITLETIENLKGIKENEEYVVKAQVQATGRKKSSLIKFAKGKSVKNAIRQILNGKVPVKEVLVEKKVKIDKESYLALAFDNAKKDFVLLYCEQGGVEIEAIRDKIKKFLIKEDKIEKTGNKEIDLLAQRLWRLARDFDALVVEINPLAQTGEKYLALDAKIIIDDNAKFRHPEIKSEEDVQSMIEKKAKLYGLQYVGLDGNIAVIGNGAGLVLSSLDCISWFGGRAANFLDIGGGASVTTVERAVEIVLMKKPKAIMINIFGGITRCDEIAKGIISYKAKKGIKAPIFIRMIGTNDMEGKKLLEENGIRALDSMEECARQAAVCSK
ncbi:ADP-forming succinate--CoA ligase subunit beta [archaeon]|nr:ADP-forming succinate--CoA ligase subunit beta [archaeon]